MRYALNTEIMKMITTTTEKEREKHRPYACLSAKTEKTRKIERTKSQNEKRASARPRSHAKKCAHSMLHTGQVQIVETHIKPLQASKKKMKRENLKSGLHYHVTLAEHGNSCMLWITARQNEIELKKSRYIHTRPPMRTNNLK